MKIVIAGAGFAGLALARALNNKPGFEVLVIDKNNYHQFQPLFYQVATGSIDISNISFPLRKVFHKSKNVRVRVANINNVDTANKVVNTNIGAFEYDKLVIPTGANTNYFGNETLKQHCVPMKSSVEAIGLRNRLINNFEKMLQAESPEELDRLKTIVVVGGGATGVELSGAIAEMRKNVLPKDYPELDFSKMKIILLEGAGKTLGAMSEKSSKHSLEYLRKLGVNVELNTIVKDYDGKTITLTNGNTIESELVIWAAGIAGNMVDGIDKSLVVRGNRVKVNRYNQIEGVDGVFALGDIAYMETEKYPRGHPQVANVALSQAKLLAKNFISGKGNTFAEQFEYKDKGSMATVGKRMAVVDFPGEKGHFKGWLAWLIWMGLHLFLLVGVKNRIQVFVNWIYKYFTSDQNLRLMFKEYTIKDNK